MTRFGNAISDGVRVGNSPGLVAILTGACERDALCRKQIAAAGDFSLSTAYRIVEKGWLEYDQLQGIVDRLPEAEAIAIASDVCRRFRVSIRDVGAHGVGLSESLSLAGGAVDLAATIHAADADRHRTAEERAGIQARISDMRRRLDQIEAANHQPLHIHVR